MHSGLYNATVNCPICGKEFSVLKVKTTAYKLNHVDEDFCMYYDEINPMFYDPLVCDHCGFAEVATRFEKVPEADKRKLQKFCLTKFNEDPSKNPFELTPFHQLVYKMYDELGSEGERDIETAMMAFNILLQNHEAREVAYSTRAMTVLKIAWLHRFLKEPEELVYLKKAAEYFIKAYETEELEEGKFDGATCAYLVGELYRRTSNPREALDWLGRALVAAQNSKVPKINDKIRDQIQVVKNSAEFKNLK